MTGITATHCRICEALCGILVEVDGDQIVSVKGDPDDPFSHGYTCPKGRALGAMHHHPQRYDRPKMRRDGVLEDAPWDRVVGDVDARLREIVDEVGADGVGIFCATGSAFDSNGRRVAERWLKLIGSRSRYTSGSIDTPCKPMVAEMMSGFAGSVPALDRENPGLILLVGVNPVVSHGHLNAFPDPVVTIRDLDERGEVWVIDPRSTETARLATRHLAPRPGTDWAVFAYLIRELLVDGADHRYLGDHTDGLERLTAAVEPYDLVRSVEVTGLDNRDLEDLLEAVRRHGRVAVQTGTGISMAATANVIEWLVWSLQIVTNSFEQPGGSWFHPGFLRALEGRAIEASDGSPEPGPPSRPELPRRLNEYPVAGMLDEIESGNLRALFVIGGNPLLAFPDSDRTRKAMEQLEVLVLCDIVENQMTPLATHVFACADQLERADLPVFLDQFLPAVMTRYAPAVTSPQVERKPLWWPFAHLARRWGLDALGTGADPDTTTDDDLLRPLGDRSRSDFDTIAEKRVVVHDPPQLTGWVHEQVLPGGRWRIAPPPLVAQLAEITDQDDGLRLVPRRQARHLNSVFVPSGRTDDAALLINPADAHQAGVASGDRVLIRSAHGSTEAVASVTDGIRPGAVSLPHGFEDANVSLLTSADDGVDPLSGMVLQSGIGVSLEVIERGTE